MPETEALSVAAGSELILDVIDFSQADDGAMVAYGLSSELDDLKAGFSDPFIFCLVSKITVLRRKP